jgi:hypothetical protein
VQIIPAASSQPLHGDTTTRSVVDSLEIATLHCAHRKDVRCGSVFTMQGLRIEEHNSLRLNAQKMQSSGDSAFRGFFVCFSLSAIEFLKRC